MLEINNKIIINKQLINSSGCENCKYCSNPSFDYESWYEEPGYCCLEWNENYWNLNSFPFKKHMPCFSPDIWFLIWIDKDLSDLQKQSFNLEMEWHIWYSNNKINSKEKHKLENKSKEVFNKMIKLAEERYWFN